MRRSSRRMVLRPLNIEILELRQLFAGVADLLPSPAKLVSLHGRQ